MGRFATTHMEINDTAIAMYIAPGGEVAEELDGVAQSAYKKMRMFATRHKRSGALFKGIKWARTTHTGAFSGEARASSSAKHTLWVERGTSTIYARRGGWLLVPNRSAGVASKLNLGAGTQQFRKWDAGGRKGPKGFSRRDSVSGQSATNFMDNALATAMAEWRAGG